MKYVLLLVVAALVYMPTSSFAAAASKGGSTMNDVGTDGCGLGWQITQKKSFLGTTTRGTTNSFVPPTFGMTFGTIGCDKHSFTKNEEAGVSFALANQENLTIELAQGEGEYVAGFAQALGCKDAAAFGQMAQAKYSEIIGNNDSAVQMYKNVRNQIAQDASLSATCGA